MKKLLKVAALFPALLAALLWCGLQEAAIAQQRTTQCTDHPGDITDVKIAAAGAASTNSPTVASEKIPVTFGQVFAPGDLPDPSCLQIGLASGAVVPFQIDSKATHPDGSVRHAILTVLVNPGSSQLILRRGAPSAPAGPPVGQQTRLQAFLDDGFSAAVKVVIDGVTYQASANKLLRTVSPSVWLSGPLVNEWQVSSPLRLPSGEAHPNLSVRFAVRAYAGLKLASVDLIVENNWAYSPAPQNYVYDVEVDVAGIPVYSKSAVTHYHHARWRKVFWWGDRTDVQVRHNTAYLIATRAVPNYDPAVVISQASITSRSTKFAGELYVPMGSGAAYKYMPSTGGRIDIGLLPGWAVAYLLSMNDDARKLMLGAGDAAGSWSMHYRDQNTDRPVSVVNYPYMSLLVAKEYTRNPKTKQYEAFPPCGGDCKTPFTADTAHTPSLTYLPYLVTGDFYYLEELQFWVMYETFMTNPEYREYSKALIHRNQERAQAWSLRDMTYAAYITPDKDSLKQQFQTFLTSNLNWYNSSYQPKGVQPNFFGALIESPVGPFWDGAGIAPWEDDFFTAAAGRAVEMGYGLAKPLLDWKVQFPIKRMLDPGYCWIVAVPYAFKFTSKRGQPPYTTMKEAYLATHPGELTALPCAGPEMAALLKLKVGEMTGYSSSATGFPSNMQPALAFAAQSGVAGGRQAWDLFMSRAVKPDYSSEPQFAIIPRF